MEGFEANRARSMQLGEARSRALHSRPQRAFSNDTDLLRGENGGDRRDLRRDRDRRLAVLFGARHQLASAVTPIGIGDSGKRDRDGNEVDQKAQYKKKHNHDALDANGSDPHA